MIDTNVDTARIRKGVANGHYSDKDLVIGVLCDEIDRLRGEKQTPQGHTVPAEAFFAVDRDGYYKIIGICGDCETQERCRREVCDDAAFDDGPVAFGRLTATLPVPEAVEVAARVEGE